MSSTEGSLDTRSTKLTMKMRENREKKSKERKRNMLYLIHSYLKEQNLNMAAEVLFETAGLSPSVEVCDNIDLDSIFQDYISYYQVQFDKCPKITKQVSVPADTPNRTKSSRPPSRHRPKQVHSKLESPQIVAADFEVPVKSYEQPSTNCSQMFAQADPLFARPFSWVSADGYSEDWKEMFDIVSKQIIPKTLGVKWTDCIGMDSVVNLLQEAIVYPVRFPDVFRDISPWKGILLYGPPGTGKTLAARAAACETNTVFINVCASNFISKWRGDSEKLVKVLFEAARHYRPCTIFIDELEAIASRRDEQQHEASRRFKSELLMQMDGLLNQDDQVFILATSNLPWEIDSAILRRFDKKLLVDLPDEEARMKIFKRYLPPNASTFKTEDLQKFSDMTKRFSGSDIKLMCKEAAMRTIRKRITDKLKTSGAGKQSNKACMLTVKDMEDAILNARPACHYQRDKYVKWQSEFGGI